MPYMQGIKAAAYCNNYLFYFRIFFHRRSTMVYVLIDVAESLYRCNCSRSSFPLRLAYLSISFFRACARGIYASDSCLFCEWIYLYKTVVLHLKPEFLRERKSGGGTHGEENCIDFLLFSVFQCHCGYHARTLQCFHSRIHKFRAIFFQLLFHFFIPFK